MRERLVAAFVGFTLVVLVLFGVPRAYQLGDLVEAQEQRKVERSADLAAVVVREKAADDQPVTPALLDDLLHEGEHLEYVAADGTTLTSSAAAPTGDTENLRATRELPGGGSVTLERSGGLVQDRVSDALLPLVLIVLALLALSVVAGVLLARRLAGPFQRLAAAARRLGTGEPVDDLPHSRIPEVDEIGDAIRTSSAQLAELRRHERDLAVHASHELRTPVTALRLELEDLALWPQTPPEVAAQLRTSVAELDRLSAAISQLLDRSRDQRWAAAQDVDLDALVATVVATLGSAAVRHEPGGAGTVHVDRVTLRLLVVTLLEQALEVVDGERAGEGAGEVLVETVDVGRHVEIRVGARGGGSGGRLAELLSGDTATQELARALGGQLSPRGDASDGVVVRLGKNAGSTPPM